MAEGGPSARVKSCGLIAHVGIGHTVNLENFVRLCGDSGTDHRRGDYDALGLGTGFKEEEINGGTIHSVQRVQEMLCFYCVDKSILDKDEIHTSILVTPRSDFSLYTHWPPDPSSFT